MGEKKNQLFKGQKKCGGSKQKCTHSPIRKKQIKNKPKTSKYFYTFSTSQEKKWKNLYLASASSPPFDMKHEKIIELNFINLSFTLKVVLH